MSVIEWLRGYVSEPHPELGRPGAVCPFVSQVLSEESLILLACRIIDRDPVVEDVIESIHRAIRLHQIMASRRGEKDLLCVVVTFPRFGVESFELIDQAHRLRKDAALRDGLMLGQFHPECPAPAARNPNFLVNRSPVPLVVVRRMAPHDHLFLDDNDEWLRVHQQEMQLAQQLRKRAER